MYTTNHIRLPKNDQVHIVKELSRAVQNVTPQYSTAPSNYIVGGYVRDLLYQNPSLDIDVEVYGVSWDTLDSLLHKHFTNARITPVKPFALWNIAHNKHTYTYSLPRLEQKRTSGHTGFTITANPALPPEQAIQRRDFTINALLLEPLTGAIYDHARGIQDIENRVLRAVDIEHLADDPLRAWRAIQHIGRFKLRIEKKTERVLRTMAAGHEMRLLSGARVREELDKLLSKSEQPSSGLTLVRSWGLLTTHLPELSDIAQSPEQWGTLLGCLDSLTHKNEHVQLQLRWEYILGAITSHSARSMIARLSIPKKNQHT